MFREILATGKDVEDAKETARLLLGASESDEIKYEVIDAGSRGIFGIINVRPAKVKATIRLKNMTTAAKPAEKPAESDAAPAPANTDNTPREDNGKRNRNRGKKQKVARERLVIAEMPDTPAEPHEAMIPESELKMEKLEVADGEDLSYDFVKKLVADIGLEAEVSLFLCEDNTRRILITGADASAFIGHHGDTLDSLQYLANLAGSRKKADGERDRRRVTVDVEGYRAKREETLRALARRMAAKALRNQRSVMLEPMNPYERRIIHSEVQNIEGVSTNSVGSDTNRKVVIYLVKKAKADDAANNVSETETAETDNA